MHIYNIIWIYLTQCDFVTNTLIFECVWKLGIYPTLTLLFPWASTSAWLAGKFTKLPWCSRKPLFVGFFFGDFPVTFEDTFRTLFGPALQWWSMESSAHRVPPYWTSDHVSSMRSTQSWTTKNLRQSVQLPWSSAVSSWLLEQITFTQLHRSSTSSVKWLVFKTPVG